MPLEIITTREVGLALAAEAIILGIFSYTAKVNLIWIFSPRSETLIARLVRRFIFASLLIGFAAYPFISTNFSVWWLVGLLLSIAFGVFIFPLITQKNIAGYSEKLRAQMEIEAKVPGDIVSSSLEYFGQQTHYIFLVVAATLIFAYGLGRKEALEQTEYFKIEGRPGWVLLKIYGEIVVSAQLDAEQTHFEGAIELGKLSEQDRLRLRKTKIGRVGPVQDVPLLLNITSE